MTSKRELSKLEKTINYTFTDASLLQMALTHSSYTNEKGAPSYERLEFLGDAVLQLIVSRCLYQRFPSLAEGTLTRYRQHLVCEATLARVANSIALGEYLFLGKGEEGGHGRQRPSILADVVEALLAALYLDGGMETAERIMLILLRDELDRCETTRDGDFKTRLQQFVEQDGQESLEYAVVNREGPDHQPIYVIHALISGNVVGVGRGSSKHVAEQMAAGEALKYFGLI